jgi:hypothetical protein
MKRLTSIIILLQLTVMVGCNPYNQIAKKPPLSVRDSLHLAQRCESAFPAESDTVWIPGQVIVDTVRLDSIFSDTLYIPGMNIDSLIKEIKRKCTPVTITKYRVDTVQLPADPYVLSSLRLERDQAMISRDSIAIALNKATLRSVGKDKYVWGFWIILAALAVLTGFTIYWKLKKPV